MISNPSLYQKFLTLTLDYISLRKISSFMICTQIFSTNNNIFDSLRGVVSQYFDPNYGILYSSLLQTWLDKLVTAMFGFWVVYITCSSLFSHFVFACNAKSFTIASLVFFFFFFILVAVFGRTLKHFFRNVLSFLKQEAYDQDQTISWTH